MFRSSGPSWIQHFDNQYRKRKKDKISGVYYEGRPIRNIETDHKGKVGRQEVSWPSPVFMEERPKKIARMQVSGTIQFLSVQNKNRYMDRQPPVRRRHMKKIKLQKLQNRKFSKKIKNCQNLENQRIY